MKRLKFIVITLISIIVFPSLVNAASGQINVSSSSTIVVGNKVTVTVTLSSSTKIGSWQMDLNYDKNYLQLVSSSAEGNGTRMVDSSAGGTTSKTYTFAFKTLKSGSTRVSVSSYLAYAYDDFSELSLNSSSKTIRIITQAELEASYSKDNNLKSLSVDGYELDKEFNKDTTEYKVNVPTGTTSVKVNATKNDYNASVSGAGEITVTEGLNTIPIVVTAENGSEKTYTIIVNVEDQNPIEVIINGKTYTVVKNETLLTAPKTFNATTIKIKDFDIPAFENKEADILLVGLKDSNGDIELYVYKNNEYNKFNKLNLTEYLLIPTSFPKDFKTDFKKTTININGEEVEAYKYSEKSRYVIINAKSLTDGKVSMYLYDPINKSLIEYDDAYNKEVNKTLTNYTYILYGCAATITILLISIISLSHSMSKREKNLNKFIEKQEAKMEATRKLNNVVDTVKKITEEEKKAQEQAKKQEQILEEKVKEVTKLEEQEEKIEPEKLSKKERKELRREQKRLAKEQKSIEESKPKIVEEPDNKEDEEEVYDLFADDKKLKRKNK